MRGLGAVLLLLITSFFAMTAPTMAQSSLRACVGVDLTSPADGAVLDDGYRTNFTWDSEPRGTASREWVSVRVDGDGNVSFDDAKRVKADPRLYKGFARGRPGIYAWAVIFYDANGNPICISEAGTYVIAGGSLGSLASDGSASGAAAAAKAALGRYVVSLVGASGNDGVFAGTVNRTIKDDYYKDADWVGTAYDWQALGYEGLDVHGSKKGDEIIGSGKGDNIWGYGGNDVIKGRGGDDKLYGGNESCSGDFCNFLSTKGDAIYGGDGDDEIWGGDESCTGTKCNLLGTTGDYIEGNAGKDTINGEGGNDLILGGSGDDTINGGNGTDVMFGEGENDNIDTGAGNGGFDIGTGGPGTDTCVADLCL